MLCRLQISYKQTCGAYVSLAIKTSEKCAYEVVMTNEFVWEH